MAMGVVCPCGASLSDFADSVPFLADFLPEQNSDAYCGAIEEAIRRHPNDPEIAASWVIHDTIELFRQAWQCPTCGRLLVLDLGGKYHSFVPESPETPRDLLAAPAKPGLSA